MFLGGNEYQKYPFYHLANIIPKHSHLNTHNNTFMFEVIELIILYFNVKWFQNSTSSFFLTLPTVRVEKNTFLHRVFDNIEVRYINSVFIVNMLYKWSLRASKELVDLEIYTVYKYNDFYT